MTLEEFVARAVRVPFAPLGRDYTGWDCYGVVYVAYRDVLGVELPRYDDGRYRTEDVRGTRSLGELVDGQLAARWQRVDAPEPLDLVVVRIFGRPVHVGLYLGERRFLHAEERVGTMVERLSSPMWARRFEGTYRRVPDGGPVTRFPNLGGGCALR